MNQSEFKKRSNRLLDLARSKSLQSDVLVKELPEFFKMAPASDELSFFLNQINFAFPSFGKELSRGPGLESLVINTPIDYLGYLRQYLKIDIGKAKCIAAKLETDMLFNKDYGALITSRQKGYILRNIAAKIQLLYPLMKDYKRRLQPHQALRWIGFLSMESSNEKQLILDLVKILSEDISKVKWQQITELLDFSIPTRGNYGVLIALINRNHQEISEGLMKIIKTPKDLEVYLQSLLSDCLAPGLLKVVSLITKKIFANGDHTFLQSFFNKIVKPTLLPNLETSKFYKDIEEIIRSTFVKTKDTFYPFKDKDIIPSLLNKQFAVQHFTFLIDLTNVWVSVNERPPIISKLQKMAPIADKDIRRRDPQQPPRSIGQLSLLSKTQSQLGIKSQKQPQISQQPSLNLITSERVQTKHSSIMPSDFSKVIMFECDDYIGLPNVGNTCYINSFIQNLHFCKEFINIFMKTDIQKYKVYQLLKRILHQLKERNKSNLKELLLQFKKQLPTTFSIDDAQQDSMEFGRQLLNSLISVPELKTAIQQIFMSKTKMITKCPDGDISSSIEQLNSQMILAFENPSIISKLKSDTQIQPMKMEQLLNGYFANHTIQGQFKCDKCKKKFNSCRRETELIELPHILIIVLSRFMYDTSIHKKRKILDVVTLEDYLHFQNIKTNSKIKAQYMLTSFVVHLGNQAESGHYQVYVRHPKQADCWVIFDDDNSVMQVNCSSANGLAKNLAVEQSPYILFYTRR